LREKRDRSHPHVIQKMGSPQMTGAERRSGTFSARKDRKRQRGNLLEETNHGAAGEFRKKEGRDAFAVRAIKTAIREREWKLRERKL